MSSDREVNHTIAAAQAPQVPMRTPNVYPHRTVPGRCFCGAHVEAGEENNCPWATSSPPEPCPLAIEVGEMEDAQQAADQMRRERDQGAARGAGYFISGSDGQVTNP